MRRKKSSKLNSGVRAAKVMAGAPRTLPGRVGSCIEMFSSFSHDLLGSRSLAAALLPSFLSKGASMFPSWQVQTGVHMAAARHTSAVSKVQGSACGIPFPQISSCYGTLCTCCLALGSESHGQCLPPSQAALETGCSTFVWNTLLWIWTFLRQ